MSDSTGLRKHPLSLLSLGDLGWIQITNFVVSGLLLVASGVGVARSDFGSTWAPRLFAASGAGLIVAGVFTSDAGAGYPIGTPDGAPVSISVHGVAHEIGFLIAVPSLIAAILLVAKRFGSRAEYGWRRAAITSVVLQLGILMWPDIESLSWRIVLAIVPTAAFVAALGVRLMRRA